MSLTNYYLDPWPDNITTIGTQKQEVLGFKQISTFEGKFIWKYLFIFLCKRYLLQRQWDKTIKITVLIDQKGLESTIMSLASPFLNGRSFEITLSVPLIR